MNWRVHLNDNILVLFVSHSMSIIGKLIPECPYKGSDASHPWITVVNQMEDKML